jgi:hypothetical protein
MVSLADLHVRLDDPGPAQDLYQRAIEAGNPDVSAGASLGAEPLAEEERRPGRGEGCLAASSTPRTGANPVEVSERTISLAHQVVYITAAYPVRDGTG